MWDYVLIDFSETFALLLVVVKTWCHAFVTRGLEQEFETRIWIRSLDHEFGFRISASKLSAIYFNTHVGETGYNISAVSSVQNLVA